MGVRPDCSGALGRCHLFVVKLLTELSSGSCGSKLGRMGRLHFYLRRVVVPRQLAATLGPAFQPLALAHSHLLPRSCQLLCETGLKVPETQVTVAPPRVLD